MNTQFLEILEKASVLLSWNRDTGVQYLDISEESIRLMESWGTDTPECTHNHVKTGISEQSVRHNSEKKQAARKYIKTAATSQQGERKTAGSEVSSKKDMPVDSITKSDNDQESCIDITGNISSQILFFSESLNYADPPGELFLNILKAMNLGKDSVCLCTFQTLDYTRGIPAVREQVADIRKEMDHLISDLKKRVSQTDSLPPRIICTFGDAALKILMGREYMLTTSRGHFHNYNGIYVMPTYHPAQILADKGLKRWVWEDMKQIMASAKI